MSTAGVPDECRRTRELVSRGLDDDLDEPGRVLRDQHVAGCGTCGSWQQQAQFLQRALFVARMEPPANVSDSLMDQLARRRRRSAGLTLAVRVALVVVAIVGAVLAWPALAGGSDDGFELHAAHEIGSSDLALALGLVAAAVWPRRARGVLAVLGVAAVLLVVTAGSDIAGGYTTFSREAPHGVVVLGALLVWALARLVPEDSGAPVLGPVQAHDGFAPLRPPATFEASQTRETRAG